jgi:hypothetical protein
MMFGLSLAALSSAVQLAGGGGIVSHWYVAARETCHVPAMKQVTRIEIKRVLGIVTDLLMILRNGRYVIFSCSRLRHLYHIWTDIKLEKHQLRKLVSTNPRTLFEKMGL